MTFSHGGIIFLLSHFQCGSVLVIYRHPSVDFEALCAQSKCNILIKETARDEQWRKRRMNHRCRASADVGHEKVRLPR